jgi:hypothetical protein
MRRIGLRALVVNCLVAEMINHGWLTPDRSVQFTDWDSGDRVIVNFGEQPFAALAIANYQDDPLSLES